MTENAFPRRRTFEGQGICFIVNRPIVISGETIAPGTVFDKTLVSERKLRQLFDQRYLRFAEPEDLPQQRERPRIRPRL